MKHQCINIKTNFEVTIIKRDPENERFKGKYDTYYLYLDVIYIRLTDQQDSS